jgi:DNA-binding IscR family transcriptional regulator
MSIGSILRAIDGPIAPLPCISRTAYRRCTDCADEKTCVVRRLFADTYAATLLLMDGTTLAEAIRGGGAMDPLRSLNGDAPLGDRNSIPETAESVE